MTTIADQIVAKAVSQLGYHEGRDPNGNWNNREKYAAQVPGLGQFDGQPWCAIDVSWVFWSLGHLNLLAGGATASVAHIRDAAKAAGRFNQFPAIGAVAIFGKNGDEHTGIVESFTATTVTTIEGNSNNTGSAQGDGVYRNTRQRTSPFVYGYSYPTYPDGIVSADPKWAKPAKPPATPVPPATHPVPIVGPAIAAARAKLETARTASVPGSENWMKIDAALKAIAGL